MKLRELTVLASLLAPSVAHAGGLFLPGSGAVSTSRAGAAVSSVDDGEALSINPSGLAKTHGTTITLSAAIIDYSMSFTRRGTYDNLAMEDQPYEGQAYPTVTNEAKPPLGIGSFQPVPVFAIASDLGGKVKGLTVAAGIYAPNAYPFRDMTNGYPVNSTDKFNNVDFAKPPPPSRYDIMKQEAAVILPSIAAAYRINDKLDIGARFSYGFAELKSAVMIWGVPANFEENVKNDGFFDVDAKANGIFGYGGGLTYRPTANIELGANYNSQIDIHAKGDAHSANGPGVNLNMNPIVVRPPPDENARCAPGGTNDAQKVCVDLALPQSAQLGGRYKFLDRNGKEKGDLELQVGWENWSNETTSTYKVVADADIYVVNSSGDETFALSLKDNAVRHNLQDVYNVRVGGSYHIPNGENEIILRGGVGFDTAAAKTGWLRADIDGAARTMFSVGGAYKTKKWAFNAGFGFIYEGSPSNPGTCNPSSTSLGCKGDGTENPINDRSGPDPINPILVPETQAENPVTQGDYKSHYVMLMLGATTWF